MRIAKRVVAVVLAFILIAAVLAGCGKKEASATTPVPGETPGAVAEETGTPEAQPPQEPEETPEVNPEATESPADNTPETAKQESPEPALEPSVTPNPPEISQAVPGAAENPRADGMEGSISGNKYENAFFGFSITAPDGWHLTSGEKLASIMGGALQYLSDTTDGAISDQQTQQIIPLVLVTPSDPAEGTDAQVACLAQNIGKFGNMIKDIRGYMNIHVKAIGAKSPNMTFGDIEVLNIDGHEVGRVSAVQTVEGVPVYNTVIYAFRKGDYVVIFTAISAGQEKATQLEEIMKTLSFK